MTQCAGGGSGGKTGLYFFDMNPYFDFTENARCLLARYDSGVSKRSVNSDNARRKLDGRAEAQLIEIACSPAPEGHSGWSLRLLEEQAKIVLETPVGKNAIGRAFKKTKFALTKTNTGAFPQKKTPNSQFTWKMFLMFTRYHMIRRDLLSVWTKSRISFLQMYGKHCPCSWEAIRKLITNMNERVLAVYSRS